MKTIRNMSNNGRKYQRGMTLIELLVAGVISLIAATGMVVVMANTLGTSSQTIQMARVSQEMRTGMQIMTRELRRANYHASFMSCYGNMDCRTTLGITAQVADININDYTTLNGESDCFWFWYDRPQSGTPVAVTAETVAAFRHTVVAGVGKLQMTTNRTTAANCTQNGDWVDITDPNIIDVLTFSVDDTDSVLEVINADGDTQGVERIGISITARLPVDPSLPVWVQSNANTDRELTEFIKVRNNTTTRFVAP